MTFPIEGPPICDQVKQMFSPWGVPVGIQVEGYTRPIKVEFEDGRQMEFFPATVQRPADAQLPLTAYVDIWKAPRSWNTQLKELGATWTRAEPQPIADQIKLHGFAASLIEVHHLHWLRISSK